MRAPRVRPSDRELPGRTAPARKRARLVGRRRGRRRGSRDEVRPGSRVAKTLAGRAAEDTCTQAQQVYGAIGFTWEHEFHRYLRRVYVLDRLFGDWRTLEFEIGTELQATTTVPRIGAI